MLIRTMFPLADHVLPSLMMQPKPSQRLPCAIGPYGVTSHVQMSLNPLWEEVTPQCASSKRKGHASQCYPSPTVWVAQGTTVVDLLCVEPGPIICLIGRIRRPTQGTGRGSSCGALVGIPILSVIRRDSEPPTERKCLGYICNAPQRKHDLMRCTCCL